jgi:predicted amidohydrolase YtcJ
MILGTTFLALSLACSPQAPAETIYHGGPIITVNDAQPSAQAVAVSGGKIIAVGSDAEVMKLKGANTKIFDLAGKTMLPGFIDAHGHTTIGGLQALSANLLSPPDGEIRDIDSLVETLKAWAKKNEATVKKINLIIGFGYDDSQLKELRHPTRDDLDKVSKDIPIFAIHQSAHLASMNSKALEVAGITASTKDPEGGVIRRKEGSQEPNGVIEENVMMMVLPKLLANLDKNSASVFAKAGVELWTKFGFTTAQEGKSNASVDAALQGLAKEGALPIDVVSYDDILLGRDHIRNSVSSKYVGHFRVAGAKLTLDGAVQGFTGFRDRPYYAPVGNYPPGYVGYSAVTAKQLQESMDWCYENKIQIITHSNGEAASDMLIATIGAAQKKYGQVPIRPVLIHGQLQREDQVDSFVKLGVIPSLFPMHTFYWGDWHRDHTVGPVNAENISPTGWYRMRGSIFTSHHDAPVAFPDAMRVLDATVTRRTRSGDILGPAQRVDVMTGIKAITIWSAYQYSEEATKGSIEVGKLADFVVLDQNPLKIDPEKIDEIKVINTIKEGKTIYTRTDAVAASETSEKRFGDAIARSIAVIADLNHREPGEEKANAAHDGCPCDLIATWTTAIAQGGALPKSTGSSSKPTTLINRVGY